MLQICKGKNIYSSKKEKQGWLCAVQRSSAELQSSNPLPLTNITKLRAKYSYFTPFISSWPIMGHEFQFVTCRVRVEEKEELYNP